MGVRYEIYTVPRSELDEDGSGAFHHTATSRDLGDAVVLVHKALARGEAVEIVPFEDTES